MLWKAGIVTPEFSLNWAAGRLGLDFSVLTDLPEQPELPQDLRPKNCFCGPDCSYIVTEAGELWACGNNRFELSVKPSGQQFLLEHMPIEAKFQ